MPLLETKGVASAQGFGLTLQQAPPVYIEDVFSTWLYTGNGSTQTITNGIDLSTKGGLVWIKQRSSTISHQLTDTARGTDYQLFSNLPDAQVNVTTRVTAFNANGFNIGTSSAVNGNGITFASWTFRKQPKFFDVVTWTGNGAGTRTIAHSLGSQPGAIFLKRTDASGAWAGAVKNAIANSYWAGEGSSTRVFTTEASGSDVASDGFVGWTSTNFKPTSFGFNGTEYNINGATYVAYLFAHNAGGFGLTGTDNVISCGSWEGNSDTNGPVVNLGYEPQWILFKKATDAANWYIFDNMRGMPVGSAGAYLFPNASDSESTANVFAIRATGFQVVASTGAFNQTGNTYIYIAIRRGPMKTPTTGTSVYGAVARTGTGASATVTGLNFPPDLFFYNPNRSGNSGYVIGWFDRLRGTTQRLRSDATSGESNYGTDSVTSYNMNGVTLGVDSLATGINTSGIPVINWFMGRAPGFFDEVCYSGTTVNPTVFNHNLGVVPELMIFKRRNSTSNWSTYYNIGASTFSRAFLNLTNIGVSYGYADGAGLSAQPTATTFTLDDGSAVNNSGFTYVAWLFASCPGVSKVGTYTGTGALQTVNCGFTGGARFVLIKRTDATSNWFVWDSTRGITSGNDPYLYLNSTATEVTGTNYVDTDSTGFKVTAAAPADLNANGGTYLFLAIA